MLKDAASIVAELSRIHHTSSIGADSECGTSQHRGGALAFRIVSGSCWRYEVENLGNQHSGRNCASQFASASSKETALGRYCLFAALSFSGGVRMDKT